MACRVAVLGCGSWGSALALHLARCGHGVRLWGHDPAHVAEIAATGANERFLPGVTFPERIRATPDLEGALAAADLCLVVVPSHAFDEVLGNLPADWVGAHGLVWATKGLDPAHGALLHEVARARFPEADLAVVSGPSFAGEVARGLPTAVTVASPSLTFAQRVAAVLHGGGFRAYTSNDLVGVEIGGAAKNVLAIAAGIADGLGFGANTRAALITRGLHELMQLGLSLGGSRETFMGLAGLGDLVLTCTDDQSRNRRFGLALAEGLSGDEARARIGQEVEGVITAKAVKHRADQLGIEMPISEQVYRVIYQGVSPNDATKALLERAQRAEFRP